jgi:hypothetical protein
MNLLSIKEEGKLTQVAGFSITALLFTLIINIVYFQHAATYTMENFMAKH